MDGVFSMNVYDFDKTIYHGDSSVHFWIYCIKRNPLILILLPIQAINFILIQLKITENKSLFFSFLKFFKSDSIVSDFWDKHEENLCDWYLKKKQNTDVIVSASPKFLIQEIARRLGVDCIASEVSFENGKCLSKNCKGQQKVVRFREHYPTAQINECYGDSNSDRFIMELAKEAYFVENLSTKGVRMNQFFPENK